MQQKEKETNEPAKEILGYSLFNDIEDSKFQAYNRCVIISNLCQEDKRNIAMSYLEAMSADHQNGVVIMAHYIKEHGFDETLREIRQ